MTLPGAVTVTFVVKGAVTFDADGNNNYATTSVTVPGCIYAPASSTEILGGRDTVISQAAIYAPTGTDLDAIDQAIVPGYGTFDVDGSPDNWPPNPFTGWLPANSVVIKLKQGTG